MKMPRIYTFDVPDFDDSGGRTMRRVEVPKAVFRQIESDVAAPLNALIHQLGENAAKAAGECAEDMERLRSAALEWKARAKALEDALRKIDRMNDHPKWFRKSLNDILAALTEPTDG